MYNNDAQWINDMEHKSKRIFPRCIFVILAIGGLLASGIYIGIVTVEGATGTRIAQIVGFGVWGLLMLWAALSRN